MTATTKTKATDDGRRAPRKTTRMLGYIVSDKLHEPVECTLLDLSASGAKLKLSAGNRKGFQSSIAELPDAFRIDVPRDKLMIDCKLAWQKEDMAGVSFRSAFRPMAAAATAARRR